MRILVIGSGAREHALVNALAHGNGAGNDVHAAPGNPGMTAATCHPDIHTTEQIVGLCRDLSVDLVVVGPEVPLVEGLADILRAEGIDVFGPSKSAARIEGSKAFAKDVMAKAGVATARAEQITEERDVDEVLSHFEAPYVVKDDGLAAGKGVVVTEDLQAAKAHAHEVLAAGNPVLVESFLDGPEISLFCLVDGETVVPLLPAQDHKRVGDNDEGPNTGGMGAYAPLPWVSQDNVDRIVNDVVRPVAKQMVAQGDPYSGLLYAGLAWGKKGPAVVEFNCRFGDPETQSVLALFGSDLSEYLLATAQNRLSEMGPITWKPGYAVTVVLAAEGYPEHPIKGDPIIGAEGTLHAGTAVVDGQLVSNGGRVLSVVGLGETLEEARATAYEQISRIELRGSHYRTDIGRKAAEGKLSVQ
ncbi:phosphoribosylamine--glycine ligase [Corynebacterium glucuronolyticum]|uniref:phosphoribosylamine--glycine ligase n=1 Tax=Corynebacterium glucuronolyticum TaxID=39791 RepID=UPI00019C20E0|nr:phosphoribosylamine--glycine ligase [Corynebacterium glucuronolyticum]EEI25917.1 phosphoribosylamine--glycine ligase [Corynebacterium glucuronolyticum ATCC 51867]QRO82573.1 phosphoribosylamine--glycine ligase [Corynebacterium glucuronolyticum]